MKSRASLLLHSCVRLGLGLLLLLGLCLALGASGRLAHAQSTITVKTCDETDLDNAINTANSESGATINFSCSGDITLSSYLNINASMTIDGSGQNVTLDGQNSTRVFFVNSGVTFHLNALTIAHGSGYGGGLANYGTTYINNTTFANNSTGSFSQGGAILNYQATLYISNTTFANNVANSSGNGTGGALYNLFSTVTIGNTTFAGNSADGLGGAIFNNGPGTSITISSSTFANNSAPASYGGAIFNGATLNIGGSIVANNSGGNCSGSVTDNGYNLDSDGSCGFNGTGDLNTNPKLDPKGLKNNGGPTQTIALQATSPAIDVIPLSANICPSTDQRGDTRPDAGETTCDMGAYEFYDDNDLNLTHMPTNITRSASSSNGAIVNYTLPTVVDPDDNSLPTPTCSPASGTTFAIGSHTVTCTVTDSDDGNSPVSKSFTVTVNPVLSINTLIATVPEGSSANNVIASGKAYVATNSLSATIDWGDGSNPTTVNNITPAASGNFSIKAIHAYAEEGSYSLTVTVNDSSSTLNVTKNETLTVSDAPLTITKLANTISGKVVTQKGTFSDADQFATVTDYTVTINWGDGNTSQVTPATTSKSTIFTTSGKHTYASHGTYTVTLTITDAGSSVSQLVTITV